MMDRRNVIKRGLGALATGLGWSFSGQASADSIVLPFANGERPLVRYPGKRPLIRTTTRPPQLETPFSVFNEGVLTPNDAFFVRYHLADIPLSIDVDAYRIDVGGTVDRPFSLSLAELKSLPAIEIVAVNQCSGNSRGFVEPRVGGGQLANGAMGNARWTGVPLKTILERARVRSEAVAVEFGALDGPVLPDTPDFVKSLDIEHAFDGEVMLAYAMNGSDLPWLNGFPVRLVVPGYYGTYWVKHLSSITVLAHPSTSFWMTTAYRVPAGVCSCVEPGHTPTSTVPISRYDVRSFLTSLEEGATVKAGAPQLLRGIAFDGGYGISEVIVSTDGGQTWLSADLGEDLGRYSFREWSLQTRFPVGPSAIKVRAANRIGQTQPLGTLWNPAGYMRNTVETVNIRAV